MAECYAYYQSPIGILKIAGTDAFITELSFVESTENITQSNIAATEVVHQCIEQLIEFFKGRRKQFNIPVHQNGTTFQQRVWNELLEIPFGTTISYLDLAKRLGDAKVIRAAAATNGKNKIAIIVPCHRVIGTDKNLVGFSGGLWRKKWLLQHEFRLNNGIQTLF